MRDKAHILISGRDRSLLETRERVLQIAGYRVSTTLQPVEGSHDLGDVRLLIICHTLSVEERRSDLALLADAYPQARALCLVPLAGAVAIDVPTLDSYRGPREMLRVVNSLLTS